MSDFKAKMYQIQFRLGYAPDPAGGAYSAPPDSLAGLRGLLLRGGGRGRDGKGRGKGKGRGGEGTRPHPFTPPLIHISGYAPDGITLHSMVLSVGLYACLETVIYNVGADHALHCSFSCQFFIVKSVQCRFPLACNLVTLFCVLSITLFVWDYAAKFARWQHPAMCSGQVFCACHHLLISYFVIMQQSKGRLHQLHVT